MTQRLRTSAHMTDSWLTTLCRPGENAKSDFFLTWKQHRRKGESRLGTRLSPLIFLNTVYMYVTPEHIVWMSHHINTDGLISNCFWDCGWHDPETCTYDWVSHRTQLSTSLFFRWDSGCQDLERKATRRRMSHSIAKRCYRIVPSRCRITSLRKARIPNGFRSRIKDSTRPMSHQFEYFSQNDRW